MPFREAKVIEQKALLKLGAELARGVLGVLPGEAVLWAGELNQLARPERGKRRILGKAKGATGTTRGIKK